MLGFRTNSGRGSRHGAAAPTSSPPRNWSKQPSSKDKKGKANARALVREDSGATLLVKKQAALLLERLDTDGSNPTGIDIGSIRRHVHRYPEDALSWVDLALGFVSKGVKDKAQRAMTVALQLAPNDRHVLRSAARMYLHLDDPEHAHDVLKRNDATKFDPWLVAGEIALSSAAERSPNSSRSASTWWRTAAFSRCTSPNSPPPSAPFISETVTAARASSSGLVSSIRRETRSRRPSGPTQANKSRYVGACSCP
jgi:hypothetical protein